MSDLRLRQAARAIVLDPDDRILLVGFELPGFTLWETPGGGLIGEETYEDAVRRELREEAGLDPVELGPVVWVRTHVVPMGRGRWDGQTERFYLVRTPAFEPVPGLSWEELRAEGMTDIRWWPIEEIERSEERFAPERLAGLLRALLRDGPPAEPIDVGI
jgi:8-oxo-dGTP pyrophosphatase MutT (NUDIX family)